MEWDLNWSVSLRVSCKCSLKRYKCVAYLLTITNSTDIVTIIKEMNHYLCLEEDDFCFCTLVLGWCSFNLPGQVDLSVQHNNHINYYNILSACLINSHAIFSVFIMTLMILHFNVVDTGKDRFMFIEHSFNSLQTRLVEISFLIKYLVWK